jgi:hypothetical protein
MRLFMSATRVCVLDQCSDKTEIHADMTFRDGCDAGIASDIFKTWSDAQHLTVLAHPTTNTAFAA